MVLGRIDEAVNQLPLAEKTDPLAPAIHQNFAFVLISAGRYDEAVEQCRKVPVDDPAKSGI
jgi:hypothetical protein